MTEGVVAFVGWRCLPDAERTHALRLGDSFHCPIPLLDAPSPPLLRWSSWRFTGDSRLQLQRRCLQLVVQQRRPDQNMLKDAFLKGHCSDSATSNDRITVFLACLLIEPQRERSCRDWRPLFFFLLDILHQELQRSFDTDVQKRQRKDVGIQRQKMHVTAAANSSFARWSAQTALNGEQRVTPHTIIFFFLGRERQQHSRSETQRWRAS